MFLKIIDKVSSSKWASHYWISWGVGGGGYLFAPVHCHVETTLQHARCDGRLNDREFPCYESNFKNTMWRHRSSAKCCCIVENGVALWASAKPAGANCTTSGRQNLSTLKIDGSLSATKERSKVGGFGEKGEWLLQGWARVIPLQKLCCAPSFLVWPVEPHLFCILGYRSRTTILCF